MRKFQIKNLFSFELVFFVLAGTVSVSIKFLTDRYLIHTDKIVTFNETIDEILTFGDMAALTVGTFLLTGFLLLTGEASVKDRWLRFFLYFLTAFSIYLIIKIFFWLSVRLLNPFFVLPFVLTRYKKSSFSTMFFIRPTK